MPRITLGREEIHIVKCPCNQDGCSKYGLSIGMFYQGAGFDKATAQRICDCYNALIEYDDPQLFVEQSLSYEQECIRRLTDA